MQSGYFARMFGHDWKEVQGVIRLEEDDPSATQAMLHFMYGYQYDSPYLIKENEFTIILHVKAYQAGDKYVIPRLKEKAMIKFATSIMESWDEDEFTIAIADVYSTTPPGDRGLRDSAVAVSIEYLPALRRKPSFQKVLRETPEFAADLVLSPSSYISLPEYKFKCHGCGGTECVRHFMRWRCACCDARPRNSYFKCPKCHVAIYCDAEAMEKDKGHHEPECKNICRTMQWFHKTFQGQLRVVILEEMCDLERDRLMPGYDGKTMEYVFAYFCKKHLPSTELSALSLRRSLFSFKEMLRLFMLYPRIYSQMIPSYLLEAGKDEVSYDFIRQSSRWKPTRSISKVIKSGLAYRDPKGKDPFYDQDFFCNDVRNFDDTESSILWCVGVIFIKVKMFLDLKTLEAITYTVGYLVPREILIQIKSLAATNWYVKRSQHLIEMDRTTKAREVLKKQIKTLFDQVNGLDSNVWPHLIFDGPLPSRESKTGNIIHEVVRKFAHLWVDNPRALQLIADIMRGQPSKNFKGCHVRTGPTTIEVAKGFEIVYKRVAGSNVPHFGFGARSSGQPMANFF
ncbi:BTB/POZ domain protein [Aspergillus affinis]|uniref:BTB/POZ domain protein n=1 Tax=Aspergillus affinis TaxID=1070780 RepID=UPI0022FE77FF|nr:BTB/POZ domain protein [Aspergillus affinis]KAI9035319.1 BTB/POZ domain protein [Aspergillus affinis]